MIVVRMGLRPSPSKIEAVQNFQPAQMVEQLRTLIGASGFLRYFVPNFSSVVAVLTDLLRRPEFSTKRSRKHPIPWGPAQDDVATHSLSDLAVHFSLAELKGPFRASHGRVRAGQRRGLNADSARHRACNFVRQPQVVRIGRETGAHGTQSSRSFVGRRAFPTLRLGTQVFTLITDCSALIWLFKS